VPEVIHELTSQTPSIACSTAPERAKYGAMRTHRAEFKADVGSELGFVDITDEIQATIDDARVEQGQATVFSPTPGCPLVINERESGLLIDIKNAIDRLEESSGADPKPMVGAPSVVLPFVDGKLRLGTWQRVLLLELEEPGPRPVVVQIVGE
jgi:secondary thiamine-phosphate synthase enzyme